MGFVFRCLLLAAFCLSAGFTHAAEAKESGAELLKARTFTDVNGRAIEAEIVALSDDTVTVRRVSDGREFPLLILRLSDADRAFLEKARPALLRLTEQLPTTPYIEALRKDFRVLKPNGLALMPVPEREWAQVRYFVIIYQGRVDADLVRDISEYFENISPRRSFVVLWLGSSNGRNAPEPESDLRAARILPRGYAVISTTAATRDFKAVEDELLAIAHDESGGKPDLFFQSNYMNRPASDIAIWRQRLMKRLPVYWPGCAYHYDFDMLFGVRGQTRFVVDREGKPAMYRGTQVDADSFKVDNLFKQLINDLP